MVSTRVEDERQRRQFAELLMGEILFVSYLEHRKVVGATYRVRREVGQLHDLIDSVDRAGVLRLIDSLRSDFNGDFLAEDSHNPWTVLAEPGFALLNEFLSRHRHAHRARRILELRLQLHTGRTPVGPLRDVPVPEGTIQPRGLLHATAPGGAGGRSGVCAL